MLVIIVVTACLSGLSIALALIGPSDAVAQQPIAPAPFTPFGDGQSSVLMADLRYQIGTTNFTIVVPAGFVTDFASTPRAIWAVLPPSAHISWRLSWTIPSIGIKAAPASRLTPCCAVPWRKARWGRRSVT